MSFSLRQLPNGDWVKLARRITFSLDFDRTFTAAPALWRDFIAGAQAAGHRVVLITRRPDTTADRDEVTRRTKGAGLDRLIFAGATQKEDAARAAGEQIDIWIDDHPAGIPAA